MRLVLLLACTLICTAYAGITETVYTATLTGYQAVPFGGYGMGNAFCTLKSRDFDVGYRYLRYLFICYLIYLLYSLKFLVKFNTMLPMLV